MKTQYTLSQLANSIQSQIGKLYAGQYWIIAEINKLNYYPKSGHCYPQLVEKRDGQIVAEMRGFIARENYARLHDRFAAETGKVLSDGMQILFLCKLSYQAVHGLSLLIVDIESGYSLGEMARMKQKAIELLHRNRIFNANKEKSLSLLPKRLAIVSVVTSKGYRDFQAVIESSKYRTAIKFKLFPALLQGDAAVESIRQALRLIAASSASFDAVAIIRGGGRETGLDCYDQYELAESVAKFPIPVLAGIGHSTNTTVVEQVAHTNLITPTDLARWIINKFQDFDHELVRTINRLMNFRMGKFELTKRDLRELTERMASKTAKIIHESTLTLQTRSYRMMQESKYNLRKQRSLITEHFPLMLNQLVKNQTEEQIEATKSIDRKLRQSIPFIISKELIGLNYMGDKLNLLDPENIVQRGYSLTLVDGKAIQNIKKLKPGAIIETRLKSGKIQSEVISTTNG